MLVLLIAAAHAGPKDHDASQVEGADAAVAEAAAPSAQQARLVEALAVKEPAAPCADVSALTPDPVTDLTWVVENVSAPPWSGIRAAECLVVGHAADARPTLEKWLTEPRLKGLGWVVLKHLDDIDLALAKELAAVSLERGPDPDGTKRRLKRTKSPELRALAGE